MARPGRKRKHGKREPNGQLSRAGRPRKRPDKGTPELRRRLEWLAQGGDPAKAEYPLGIMLVNDIIDQKTHDAACRYAWLHCVVHGHVSLAASQIGAERLKNRHSGHVMTEDMNDAELERWQAARLDELKAVDSMLDTSEQGLLFALVIAESKPRWMLPKARVQADVMFYRQTERVLKLVAHVLGS